MRGQAKYLNKAGSMKIKRSWNMGENLQVETNIKIWTKTKCPIPLNNYATYFFCVASVSHS